MAQSNFYKTLATSEQFQNVLNQADAKTLVVFDLDDTLLVSCDQLFRYQFRHTPIVKRVLNRLQKHFNGQGGKSFDHVHSQLVLDVKFDLMDSYVPQAISSLQQRGIKTMALTYMRVGAYGVIPDKAEWRYQQLKSFGFDFSKAWQDYQFKGFSCENGLQPLFYKGVLATNKLGKGIVFEEFLRKLPELTGGWHPLKVMCFDDREDWLKELGEVCFQRGLGYQGFRYMNAVKEPGALNEQLLEAQCNHLIQHNQWLGDEEVQKLLL